MREWLILHQATPTLKIRSSIVCWRTGIYIIIIMIIVILENEGGDSENPHLGCLKCQSNWSLTSYDKIRKNEIFSNTAVS